MLRVHVSMTPVQICVVLGAVFSLCCVRDLVCARLSLCDVQFAATNMAASLRECLASMGRKEPREDPTETLNRGPREAPNNLLCHVGISGGDPPINLPSAIAVWSCGCLQPLPARNC